MEFNKKNYVLVNLKLQFISKLLYINCFFPPKSHIDYKAERPHLTYM